MDETYNKSLSDSLHKPFTLGVEYLSIARRCLNYELMNQKHICEAEKIEKSFSVDFSNADLFMLLDRNQVSMQNYFCERENRKFFDILENEAKKQSNKPIKDIINDKKYINGNILVGFTCFGGQLSNIKNKDFELNNNRELLKIGVIGHIDKTVCRMSNKLSGVYILPKSELLGTFFTTEVFIEVKDNLLGVKDFNFWEYIEMSIINDNVVKWHGDFLVGGN